MDPLSIFGLATAGAGLVGRLWEAFSGKSKGERERERRKDELLREIDAARARTLTRGVKAIGQRTAGAISGLRGAASRRAQALGQRGGAESFILPGEQKIAGQGTEATTGYVEGVNKDYDRLVADVWRDYQNRPISEDWIDVASDVGPQIFDIAQSYAGLDRLRGSMPEVGPESRSGAYGGGRLLGEEQFLAPRAKLAAIGLGRKPKFFWGGKGG